MKKRFLLVAALFSAFMLAACGGGNEDRTVLSATSDLTVEMNAANGPNTSAALVHEVFVYPSGVSEFGTTGLPTTVVWTNTATTPDFRIESDGNSASGVTEFGSCRFRVTASNYPASSPLATGKVVTIASCLIIVRTRLQPADGIPRLQQLHLILNTTQSNISQVTVAISSSGEVTVNGRVVGTVPVADLTGGA